MISGEQVTGNPGDPEKKLIVIATHSASLLPLRRISELTKIVFFSSAKRSPAQIAQDDKIFENRNLAALVTRLSSTHRAAMFGERVLLVEGASDEIIATQLSRCLDFRLLARNVQILPVDGKGELISAAKLFNCMKKNVCILADLDAFSDNNKLVNYFSTTPEAADIANKYGRSTIADFDRDLRNQITNFMENYQNEADVTARAHPDWSDKNATADTKRRICLARLLTDPLSFAGEAAAPAKALNTQLSKLLAALEELGCFFLRRGTIENYYAVDEVSSAKPDRAAKEAASFEGRSAVDLEREYADIIAALKHIAPDQRVDEDLLLRPRLGAILTACFLIMDKETTNEKLNSIAKEVIGPSAGIFNLSNASKPEASAPVIKVDLVSPIFKRNSFPFEVSKGENPNDYCFAKLPGLLS